MKISVNGNVNSMCGAKYAQNSLYKLQDSKLPVRVVSYSEFKKNPLSFTGHVRNKSQAIYIGAEISPFSQAGGVGTVMKDYASMQKPEDEVLISPYYGAKVNENKEIVPVKDEDGDYVLSKGNDNYKLTLVKTDDMQWGKKAHNKIMLFKLKDENDKNRHYFVFNPSTAAFEKPYENEYQFSIRTGIPVKDWNGDPYAQFSKAAVQLLPAILEDKKGFDPATIVCSDAQTAYVHEYMAKNSLDDSDSNPWHGIKPTYVGHNLGPGYCGETSKQKMFVNLGATPEEIEMIENDPIYKQTGDEYFRPYVEETIDANGAASAVMIPIHYTKKGYSGAITTVSEEYAHSIATIPAVAPNLYPYLSELYNNGTFKGILNPLNDPKVNPSKELPIENYRNDCKDKDGKIFKKFDVYPTPDEITYKSMRNVKNKNKLKLLERLSAKDTTIITGNPSKTATIRPEAKDRKYPIIKPSLLRKIRRGHGDEVPLFVSWGRADTQKGHEITLEAFAKFAKTKEGKNAILILGSTAADTPESNKFNELVLEYLKDPDLQGRIVHLYGWSPGCAFTSAADYAIFSSRFEPCGITDLEAMKFYCTPIVVNTQGFKQKNFDPEEDEEKATSFKTKHEFYLTKKEIQPIIEYYVNGNIEAYNNVKEEFPVFKYTKKDGSEGYDDTLFKDFAEKYSKFIQERKEALIGQTGSSDDLPLGWDDWDELSKNYDFNYSGFARELKDGILSAEMAKTLSRAVSADKDLKVKIFENLLHTNTGWDNNGKLHPDGKSSKQLYEEIHLEGEYNEPAEDDTIKPDREEITKQTIKRQREDLHERIRTYTSGALVGLGGILFRRTGNNEFKNNDAKYKKIISELENKIETITKTGRKNIAKAAVISAACASLVSVIITKALCGKKKKNDKDVLTIPETKTDKSDANSVQEAANNTSDTQTPMKLFSFEQYRKSLNKMG